MNYYKSDNNMLKCAGCGKYKVDTLEEFEVNYKADGTKEWLCSCCNKYKKLFKGSLYGTNLIFVITPPASDVDVCKVYSKDLYV